MSNERLSNARIVCVVALVSVGLAACDPGANWTGETTRIQAGLQPEPTTLLPAMPPHALRAQLDAVSGRLWALHAEEVHVHDATAVGTTTSIHLPGWSWATAPWACPPDLALAGNRGVLVTSNVSPAIWRIDSETLEVTRHDLDVAGTAGRDVGNTRLLDSAHHETLFAAGALDNSLWLIDRMLTRAQPITLTPPLPQGCVLSVLPGHADNALCLQIEHGDWIVTLSADRRSGKAHPGGCSSKGSRVDVAADVACSDPTLSARGRRNCDG